MALSLPPPRCARAQERCLLSILPIRISLQLPTDHKTGLVAEKYRNGSYFYANTAGEWVSSARRGRGSGRATGRGRGRACLRRRQSATVQSEDALIGARKDRAFCRWLSAADADAGPAGLF